MKDKKLLIGIALIVLGLIIAGINSTAAPVGLVLLIAGVVLIVKSRKQKGNASKQGSGNGQIKSADEIIAEKQAELDGVNNLPDLAPEEMNGLKRTYHYKDVKLVVDWNLTGGKGKKSVESLGIKRGDVLAFDFTSDTISGMEDPNNVAVMWNGVRLGDMKENRMREMVSDWVEVGLPVYCAMAKPSFDSHFYLEVAFYGKPKGFSATKEKAEKKQTNDGQKVEHIRVAGLSFRTEDVQSLLTYNPDYELSEKEAIEHGLKEDMIYEYKGEGLPVRFEYEPENEYDSNAIAIYVREIKIGYVKKGSTAHIRKLIDGGKIKEASCDIRGGNFKFYSFEDKEFEYDKSDYSAKITLVIEE